MPMYACLKLISLRYLEVKNAKIPKFEIQKSQNLANGGKRKRMAIMAEESIRFLRLRANGPK